jgi:Ceramidase
LVIVGLGSFAFHATLLYSSQMADELPMSWAALSWCYIQVERGPKERFPSLPRLLWLYSLITTIWQVALTHSFPILLEVQFGLMFVYIMYVNYKHYYCQLQPGDPHFLFWLYAVTAIVAFLGCWVGGPDFFLSRAHARAHHLELHLVFVCIVALFACLLVCSASTHLWRCLPLCLFSIALLLRTPHTGSGSGFLLLLATLSLVQSAASRALAHSDGDQLALRNGAHPLLSRKDVQPCSRDSLSLRRSALLLPAAVPSGQAITRRPHPRHPSNTDLYTCSLV